MKRGRIAYIGTKNLEILWHTRQESCSPHSTLQNCAANSLLWPTIWQHLKGLKHKLYIKSFGIGNSLTDLWLVNKILILKGCHINIIKKNNMFCFFFTCTLFFFQFRVGKESCLIKKRIWVYILVQPKEPRSWFGYFKQDSFQHDYTVETK